jgi:putative DNA primase/helicase
LLKNGLFQKEIVMSKYSLDGRPNGQDVALRLGKDGIYAMDDNNNRTRIADPIRVTAFATSDPNTAREEAFSEIRFLDRRAKWKIEIIPPSMLTLQTHEFISLLSKRGYM